MRFFLFLGLRNLFSGNTEDSPSDSASAIRSNEGITQYDNVDSISKFCIEDNETLSPIPDINRNPYSDYSASTSRIVYPHSPFQRDMGHLSVDCLGYCPNPSSSKSGAFTPFSPNDTNRQSEISIPKISRIYVDDKRRYTPIERSSVLSPNHNVVNLNTSHNLGSTPTTLHLASGRPEPSELHHSTSRSCEQSTTAPSSDQSATSEPDSSTSSTSEQRTKSPSRGEKAYQIASGFFAYIIAPNSSTSTSEEDIPSKIPSKSTRDTRSSSTSTGEFMTYTTSSSLDEASGTSEVKAPASKEKAPSVEDKTFRATAEQNSESYEANFPLAAKKENFKNSFTSKEYESSGSGSALQLWQLKPTALMAAAAWEDWEDLRVDPQTSEKWEMNGSSEQLVLGLQPASTEVSTSSQQSAEATTSSQQSAEAEATTSSQQSASSEVKTSSQQLASGEVNTSSQQLASSEVSASSQQSAEAGVNTLSQQPASPEVNTSRQTSSEVSASSQLSAEAEVSTSSQQSAEAEVSTSSQQSTSSEVNTSAATSQEHFHSSTTIQEGEGSCDECVKLRENSSRNRRSRHIYSISSNPRGVVVIFNYIFEKDPDWKRDGAELGGDNLKSVFEMMNYSVHIYVDFTKQETFDQLEIIISIEDLWNIDSLLLFFLSHGKNQHDFYASDKRLVPVQDIWNLLTDTKCPSMEGKAKLLFLNYCRGNKKQKNKVYYDDFNPDDMEAPSDLAIIQAALPGFLVGRLEDRGTIFVDNLCNVLLQFATSKDLQEIVYLTSKQMQRQDGSTATLVLFDFKKFYFVE